MGVKSAEKIFSKIFENPVRIRPLAALLIVEGDFVAAGQSRPSAIQRERRDSHDRSGVG